MPHSRSLTEKEMGAPRRLQRKINMLTAFSWLHAQIALAVMSGLTIGFCLGLVGGGGGILGVPLLLYFVKIDDPHVAIGSTALSVALIALFNLAGYARAGLVRWQVALIFAVCGAAGAFAGSALALHVNGRALLLLLALMMLVVAARMLHGAHQQDAAALGSAARAAPPKPNKLATAGAALATGSVSGFFGIGGGFLIVPALHFVAGISMLESVASSLLSVVAFGTTTAVNYALAGKVSLPLALALVGGGIAGGRLGMQLAQALRWKNGVLNMIFAGILLLVAAYIAYCSD